MTVHLFPSRLRDDSPTPSDQGAAHFRDHMRTVWSRSAVAGRKNLVTQPSGHQTIISPGCTVPRRASTEGATLFAVVAENSEGSMGERRSRIWRILSTNRCAEPSLCRLGEGKVDSNKTVFWQQRDQRYIFISFFFKETFQKTVSSQILLQWKRIRRWSKSIMMWHNYKRGEKKTCYTQFKMWFIMQERQALAYRLWK